MKILKKYMNKDLENLLENRIEQLLEHKEIFHDSKFHFIAPLQSRK